MHSDRTILITGGTGQQGAAAATALSCGTGTTSRSTLKCDITHTRMTCLALAGLPGRN
jgi:NAD(P)-dependent dehydrogenase (short-subunit alcohol dehydrogenase family)